jgi:hypothetical protein
MAEKSLSGWREIQEDVIWNIGKAATGCGLTKCFFWEIHPTVSTVAIGDLCADRRLKACGARFELASRLECGIQCHSIPLANNTYEAARFCSSAIFKR